MNRLRFIINLILGKKIIVYNSFTKEIICVIGSNEEIIQKRYDYDYIDNEECIICENHKILYDKE